MHLRAVPRLAIALVIGYLLVLVTNSAPGYLGPLEQVVLRNEFLFVGVILIVLSSLLLWWGGYWLHVQSWRRLAAFEVVEAVALVLAATAVFGLGLTPLNLCLGGGGGFVCYPDMDGFLFGLLGLLTIVLAEELFFRAYLMNELGRIIGGGLRVVVVATVVYTVFHLPALGVEGFGVASLQGFLQVALGAFTLSACYWYTGRNLAAVVILHAYWDAIGSLVLIPSYGQYSEFVLVLGQLSLPAFLLVLTHALQPLTKGMFRVNRAMNADSSSVALVARPICHPRTFIMRPRKTTR